MENFFQLFLVNYIMKSCSNGLEQCPGPSHSGMWYYMVIEQVKMQVGIQFKDQL